MNPPRRYLDGEAGLARTLLRSAEQDAPTNRSRQRALAATALAAAASTAAPSAAAGTIGAGLVVKWLAIGAVAGSIVAAGGSTLLDAGSRAPSRAPVATAPARLPPARTRPKPSPQRAAAPVIPPQEAPPAVPAQRRAVPQHVAPPAKADTLSRQLAVMDSARKKLAAGDAAGAIVELDRYRAEFPEPSFGQEAALLRAEALVLEGNCAAALALAPKGSSVFSRRWRQLKARCR